ncbi:3233_t:CDS:2 [Paraglomus brasilianum]|uniref:3233_t:CDS:1 n=1 Tax=Paraglomus brasilianum TaxID=144538 RepID=A0A9N9BVM6_9GLOM|nr:3233_t:CDS:2 [Paraglomus brasilianum]
MAEPSGSQGSLRRRQGGGAITNRASSSATMLKFYTDDSPGLKVDPVAVIIIALAFIGSVFLLHIYGKFTRG